MPPQMKNMINNHRVMFGCKIYISWSMMRYELNARRSRKMAKLISVSKGSNSIRPGNKIREIDVNIN